MGGGGETTIFSNSFLTTLATEIFLKEAIQDTASKVYTDVIYTMTLNLFWGLVLEHEMLPHDQGADVISWEWVCGAARWCHTMQK